MINRLCLQKLPGYARFPLRFPHTHDTFHVTKLDSVVFCVQYYIRERE